MTIFRSLSLLAAVTVSVIAASAQAPQDRYKAFKENATKNYTDFRKEANKRYADFIRAAWESYDVNSPVEKPDIDYVVPEVRYEEGDSVVIVSMEALKASDETDGLQESVAGLFNKIKRGVRKITHRDNKENRRLAATVVDKPDAAPVPQPIAPVGEDADNSLTIDVPAAHSFTFFGTEREVRLPTDHELNLKNLNNNTIANAWLRLSEKDFDPLLKDCLDLRSSMNLNDWCYLKMLEALSQSIYGDSNEGRLFTAYMFCQSGYAMRLTRTPDRKRLGMMFPSQDTLYSLSYLTVDGTAYYLFNCGEGAQFQIVPRAFDNESRIRLLYADSPKLDVKKSTPRRIRSIHYPDLDMEVSVNENLIDFYNSYPDGVLGGNFLTRFAFHADIPLDSCVKASLYPALSEKIRDMSKVEAAGALLNWLQTGFVYEFDNKVWGGDRVFFAEETLFYPFCDCEDRAILYSKLVRDLLGLKAALVYYPGHLAAAVCFDDEPVSGAYINIDGRKFVICDPTYIVAGVGTQMTCVDDTKIQAIEL